MHVIHMETTMTLLFTVKQQPARMIYYTINKHTDPKLVEDPWAWGACCMLMTCQANHFLGHSQPLPLSAVRVAARGQRGSGPCGSCLKLSR